MYPKKWTQRQDFGTRIYREPILSLIMMHLSWICGGSVVNLWWIYCGPVPDASSFFQFEELNLWKSWKFVWNGSIWLDMAWSSRQNDCTDVAHLFCFQEIIKNLPRGPKNRPMTPKIFFTHIRELNYGVSIPNLSWIYGECLVNVSWTCPRCQQLFQFEELNLWKSLKFVWNGSIWLGMSSY